MHLQNIWMDKSKEKVIKNLREHKFERIQRRDLWDLQEPKKQSPISRREILQQEIEKQFYSVSAFCIWKEFYRHTYDFL